MTYKEAKQLHNEDEVRIKETGEIRRVLDAYVNPLNHKYISVECDDGNTYYHDQVE